MELQTFNRKSFPVTGVRVSDSNMAEVAEWCGGQIRNSSRNDEAYIKVPVINPLSNRHTLAFVGDWILLSTMQKPEGEQKSFKVYVDASLWRNFEPATT